MIYIGIPFKISGIKNSGISTEYVMINTEYFGYFTKNELNFAKEQLLKRLEEENLVKDPIVTSCSIEEYSTHKPSKNKSIGVIKAYYRVFYKENGERKKSLLHFTFPFGRNIEYDVFKYSDETAYEWAKSKGYDDIHIIHISESEYLCSLAMEKMCEINKTA